MRIGIFTDRYLPQTDGICFSVETFRVEMEKLGHEVYVFAPRPSWRYKERSGRIIRFPAVKGLFFEDQLTSLFFPPQAIKRIDSLKLDIIHFQTPGQIGLLGMYYGLRNNIPIVTTYHTDLYEYVKHYPKVLPGTIALSLLAPVITAGGMAEYREVFSSITPSRSLDKWNQKIVMRVLTMVHNHCDLVITPSRKMEKQLRGWKTKSRIATLPTGVDKIVTRKRETTMLRKKYGLAATDKIISFVGRIGTEKNLGLLIEAFEFIASKIPTAKLLIAGPGDDLEYFKDMAAKSAYAKRIIFTGYIDRQKLGGLYGASTVFAFPSQTDTQGMVVNEAACAGIPIVMVDRNITEVVRNNQNGYFTRSSAHNFADKIIAILKDDKLQARMAKRSVELAAEVSATRQAEKLVGLYDETIRSYKPKVEGPLRLQEISRRSF